MKKETAVLFNGEYISGIVKKVNVERSFVREKIIFVYK